MHTVLDALEQIALASLTCTAAKEPKSEISLMIDRLGKNRYIT